MNTNTMLWLAGVSLALVTFAQWALLRSRYLDGLTQQRARHAQQMLTTGQHIEHARRQIAQLQMDLGTTRSQLARLTARHGATLQAARQASAVAPRSTTQTPRHSEPFDGFADTLPSQQYPHDPGLLATYPARR